jgi:outer membrane receptor protein involved in Fe transport
VLASTRVDRYRNYEGSDVIVNGAAQVYPAVTQTEIDPRVSFRYAASSTLAVRGAAYRAFKAPTLRDLYRNSQVGTVVVVANPHLQPETLTGADLGLEWAFGRSHAELNFFQSEIDAFHIRAGIPGQPANVVQLQNAGAARSRGLEAVLSTRVGRRWAIQAGYTYADATITEAPDTNLVGNEIPDVVPHIGSLAVRFTGDHGTRVDLRGRVLSRSYGEPANVTAAPSHRIVDLAVSHPVRPWLRVYAIAENLLDEEYFFLLLTPTNRRVGTPRTITAGVRMAFGPRP